MATATDLMGVGVPAEVAKRTGVEILAVTASGTTQSSGPQLKGPGNLHVNVTAPSGSDDAVTLAGPFDLGDEVTVTSTTTAVDVFPQEGGQINNNTVDAHATVSLNNSRTFRKVSATHWWALNA